MRHGWFISSFFLPDVLPEERECRWGEEKDEKDEEENRVEDSRQADGNL